MITNDPFLHSVPLQMGKIKKGLLNYLSSPYMTPNRAFKRFTQTILNAYDILYRFKSTNLCFCVIKV